MPPMASLFYFLFLSQKIIIYIYIYIYIYIHTYIYIVDCYAGLWIASNATNLLSKLLIVCCCCCIILCNSCTAVSKSLLVCLLLCNSCTAVIIKSRRWEDAYWIQLLQIKRREEETARLTAENAGADVRDDGVDYMAALTTDRR